RRQDQLQQSAKAVGERCAAVRLGRVAAGQCLVEEAGAAALEAPCEPAKTVGYEPAHDELREQSRAGAVHTPICSELVAERAESAAGKQVGVVRREVAVVTREDL